MNSQTIFFIFFGVVAASMLFKSIKHRGWKGAMFGAPVVRQIGELELPRRGMVKTKLKLHVLDPSDAGEGPHVGVELIQSAIGSWEMKPVSLTRAEARRLAEELVRAADASEVGKSSGLA
jgi:hypothetical protein